MKVALVCLLAVVAALVPVACTPNALFGSCTVGYAGTDLNVTVEGVGANAACQQLVKLAPGGGSSSDLSMGSGYSTSPSGTVMCQYTINDLTYTVRDQGALKLYGAAACQWLSQQTPEAKKRAQQQQAAAAQAQANQQKADQQAAIDQAAAKVADDIGRLQGAGQTIGATLTDAPQHASQAQADLGKTQQDYAKAMNEPDQYAACSDAYTVQDDAYTVQDDVYALNDDATGEAQAVQGVQRAEQAVEQDLQALQAAEAARPSYRQGQLPAQADVDAARNAADGAIGNANQQMSGYQATAQAALGQANQLARAATGTPC